MPPVSLVPADDRRRPAAPARDRAASCRSRRTPPATRSRPTRRPILARAGPLPWVTLELTGNTRFTPRVRSLRAEHPAHDYLRRLPKVFSREPQPPPSCAATSPCSTASSASSRHAPPRDMRSRRAAAPAEVLPWLAGFVGLVLDERWPVAVQRAILAEARLALPLSRHRAGPPALSRSLHRHRRDRDREVPPARPGRRRRAGRAGIARGAGRGFRVGGALAEGTFTPIQARWRTRSTRTPTASAS